MKRVVRLTESDIHNMVYDALCLLNEGTAVTFGGKAYPTSGWAVIVVGGVSSGKTTIEKSKLLINGKIINSDHWREIVADAVNTELDNPDRAITNITKTDTFHKLKNKMPDRFDLSNYHNANKIGLLANDKNGLNLINKQKEALLNGNSDNGVDRLPNLLFEIGSEPKARLGEIINYLSKFKNPYRISVVWVVSNRQVAFASMLNRNRQLGPISFHTSHNDMLDETIGVMSAINNFKDKIEEAWCVITSTASYDSSNTRIDRRLKSDETNNVYKMVRDDNGDFNLPQLIDLGNDSDTKTVDDVIGDIKKVRTYNGRVGTAKAIPDQDIAQISYDQYPTIKNATNWAKTHNGQFLKNVDIFQNNDKNDTLKNHSTLFESIVDKVIKDWVNRY